MYLDDIPEFAARTDLADDVKRQILRDNAVRLYRL